MSLSENEEVEHFESQPISEIDDPLEVPTLDFVLNSDIRMLCLPLIAEVISTADWQLCCAEKLVHLDSEYCDLLPDLYKNIPQGWFYQTGLFASILFSVNRNVFMH